MDFSASQRVQRLNDMQHELDMKAGRPVQDLIPTGPIIMTAEGMKPLLGGPKTGRFSRPLDEDFATPEEELAHERMLRQKIYAPSYDSHGPSPRLVVPPPPPIDPDAPEAYIQPSVKLGAPYYVLLGLIVSMFMLMIRFGQ